MIKEYGAVRDPPLPCSGTILIALIGVMLLMALLSVGVVMVLHTGILETVEMSGGSGAFFAAETGLSVGKAFCRTNAAWIADAPITLAGTIGDAAYSAVITTSAVSAHVTTTTVWIGTEPLTWRTNVLDGYHGAEGRQLSKRGQVYLRHIRDDDGDGVSHGRNYADRGNSIGDRQWFSVYFPDTFPASATNINSAKICVDHEGPAGKAGTLVLHVSENRTSTGWYNGGTGASDGNSGNVAWDQNEQRYEFDVSGVLNTIDKINNCEALILNRSTSGDKVYFDYAYIEVEYLIAPTQTTVVTTSTVPYAVITSTGRRHDGKWTSIWMGPGGGTGTGVGWTSDVLDGYHGVDGRRLSKRGRAYLGHIRDDDGDGVSHGKNFADISDAITDMKWYSVYFNNDFPADTEEINSVKIYIDHEGPPGATGDLVVHVSTDKAVSSWYTGGTGASAAQSGDVAWSSTENRYEYDATDVLNTAEKINNCEILILNRQSSSDRVYFDYIYIEVN